MIRNIDSETNDICASILNDVDKIYEKFNQQIESLIQTYEDVAYEDEQPRKKMYYDYEALQKEISSSWDELAFSSEIKMKQIADKVGEKLRCFRCRWIIESYCRFNGGPNKQLKCEKGHLNWRKKKIATTMIEEELSDYEKIRNENVALLKEKQKELFNPIQK